MTTILYIEDNDDNIYMLSRRLQRRNVKVVEARDGERGVEVAKSVLPDLIIMDLILPGLDGWEATRQIKGCEQTADIPIIALSSNASTEDRSKSLAAGCDAFETKPVDFERLFRKIKQLLK